jgi:hypothetical protein
MDSILGIPVPVFGCTGARYSGKTILGGSLAPGVFPDGHAHAGKSRTLILDFEGSSETYALPADRIDVPARLRQEFGAKAYKQVDAFQWFRDLYQSIPVGRFDVIMVDPISDIEAGGVIWAKEHPEEFGYTAGQFAKMEAVAIDAAKKMWKAICLDLATRCQIFYFTTHERLVWEGGRPVKGKTSPKGMDYLFECSSLYLKLSRETDVPGEPRKPPSAEVLKSRLAFTSVGKDGELDICEVLPQRLPVATKAAIMKYVKHPIGRRKAGLTADEIAQDKALSDDEKLLIQQEIAQNKAVEATANLSRVELMRLAAMAGGQCVAIQTEATAESAPLPTAVTTTGNVTTEVTTTQAVTMATDSQIAELEKRLLATFDTPEAGREWFLSGSQGLRPRELTESAMTDCLIALCNLQTERVQRKAEEKLAASGTTSTVNDATQPPAQSEAAGDGMATQQQRERIKALAEELGISDEQHLEWLRARGVSSYRSISTGAADERIAELQAMLQPRPVPVQASDGIPF